ncbi:MAG: histidine phosphatase family protein [Pseudomonadota bacterium]
MPERNTVYLVRHGETEFNREGRYQGRSDSPLTALGVAQAERAGRTLAQTIGAASAKIRTSPLGRAVQTAEIIARNLAGPVSIQIDPRLAEIGMGTWEGMTRTEVRAGWPEARKGKRGRNWIFEGPGSEQLDQALARITGALEETSDPTMITALVSHANTGRLLRGLHAGLSGEEAMCLDAPQEAIFRLCPGGEIRRIDTAPAAYQGFHP